jgi:SAM-dependent methyltransferase
MSSALKQVFLGGDNPEKTRDNLLSIIKKALTDRTLELEAILHGNTGERNEEISMDQFQRVVGFLRGVAEPVESGESVYLNIQGGKNFIRASVNGDTAIGDYCVDDILPESTEFVQKRRIVMAKSKDDKGRRTEKAEYYEFKDYGIGYRVNLKMEDTLRKEDPMVRDLQSRWSSLTKTFRLIQRESFYVGMFRIDCSRVRQGRGKSIESSGCLDNVPTHEIEIELVRDRMRESMSVDLVLKSLLKNVLRVMRILRNSWFLMRDERVAKVVTEYGVMTGQVGSSPRFIGPMPITLARTYLYDIRSGTYTATMKADGERALFLITPKGEGYLMYRSMKVEDTGMIVHDERIRDSIFDGEIITRIKDPVSGGTKPIHPPMYLIFDCYRANGKNVHTLPLLEDATGGETRLGVASVLVDTLASIGAHESKWGDDKHIMNISMKPFVMVKKGGDTEGSLRELIDSDTLYETDGIVFTPNGKSVNNCRDGELGNIRGTWDEVMKWKPPEDNTIDFLLRLDPERKMSASGEYYREGVLCVYGNDMTPDVLYELQTKGARDIGREMRSRENMVVPFYGGDHRIQLFLNEGGAIISKAGDVVEDGMIIECVWNAEKPSSEDDRTGGWEIRNVRWDKTAMFRKGQVGGTMNNDRTAKSVWETSVSDRLNLEDLWDDKAMYIDSPDGGDDDTGGYFNSRGKRSESVLARMRDFHNLVVKKYLISPKRQFTTGKKIVDLACGKGGDIPRYQKSGAGFVFGIDIVPDNILNPSDGAIRRYIGFKGRKVGMRFALADCGKDLFARDTAGDSQSREIIRKMFSAEGMLAGGADRVVCMFAMHYFFKNNSTLDAYFGNVSRILRPAAKDETAPPCFVACYFDSERVHTLLKDKGEIDAKSGNVVYRALTDSGELAWSIEGLYDIDTIAEGESPEGTGLEIKVYIRSINKSHNEYLVGRQTFASACESHGMRLVQKDNGTLERSKKAGYSLPGMTFDKLFKSINDKDNVGKARDMLSFEKELSFLYRCDFVLKV